MMDDRALIQVMKALADPRRFRMIQELAAAGELSCGQIGERFPLAQSTISHHLKVLNDAGLLVVRRGAQHALVSVNQELIDRVLQPIPARLMTCLPRDSGVGRKAADKPAAHQ
jgi:ArsR family transcriptional regulator